MGAIQSFVNLIVWVDGEDALNPKSICEHPLGMNAKCQLTFASLHQK